MTIVNLENNRQTKSTKSTVTLASHIRLQEESHIPSEPLPPQKSPKIPTPPLQK